ncbi:hypothetical protein MRX96_004584 [Rhipicephalus microplus]
MMAVLIKFVCSGAAGALPTPSGAVPRTLSAQLTLSIGAGVVDLEPLGDRVSLVLLRDRDWLRDGNLDFDAAVSMSR